MTASRRSVGKFIIKIKMAEGIVVEPPLSARFYCHQCNEEIGRVSADYKCPTCQSGFIEELENTGSNNVESSSDDSADGDVDMDLPFSEQLAHNLWDGVMRNANAGQVSSQRGGDSSSGPSRQTSTDENDGRPVLGDSMRSRRSLGAPGVLNARGYRRRRDDRQMAPLENMIHEFIVNLTGMDWESLGGPMNAQPMFMYGNPGDYAWGRGGLDAIITQLLNQMDGTGPPPMQKDQISAIPVVHVTEEHIDKNLQCSVCWEDFKVAEPVRKLSCEHLYHSDCIVPWLELHGTCPVCRKTLSEDLPNGSMPSSSSSSSAQQPNQSQNSGLGGLGFGSMNSSSSASSSSSTSDQSRPPRERQREDDSEDIRPRNLRRPRPDDSELD